VDLTAVRAAGGLVWRIFRNKPEVLIVHRPAYDDWSLPKGKLEDGESESAAALREVFEETSLRCSLGPDIGSVSYRDANGRPKTVRYWQMRVVDGKAMPDNEVDDVRWVGFDEASVRLSYLREREILRRFTPPVAPGEDSTIFLVRHAKAGDRELWRGDDTLRPLSDGGWRQVHGITRRLSDRSVVKLLSSPHSRCVQTLEPLAEELDLSIQEMVGLSEGSDASATLAELAGEATDGSLVASTHGDPMMPCIEMLLDQGVRLRGDKVDFKKGCTWELVVRDGVYVSARYRRPPKDT
jgi:8-oxo-dGTP diphosphatase